MRSSSSVAWTATIAPPAGRSCISRPRAATRRAGVGRERTPATCAAAISPTEWPSRKSGVTPHGSTSRKRATSTANSAGWVYPVRSSRAPSGRPRREQHVPQRPVESRRRARRRPRRGRRRTPGRRRYSSRPMPGRWLPWPVKRNASAPGGGPAAHESGAAVAVGERGERRRAAPSRSAATSTARCANAGAGGGQRCSATSAGSSVGVRRRGGRAAVRPGRAAPARSRPETQQRGRSAAADPARPAGGGAAAAGASVSTTWQLVPPMPKELTPATSGPSGARPRRRVPCLHPQAELVQRDRRVRGREVQARRELAGGARRGRP